MFTQNISNSWPSVRKTSLTRICRHICRKLTSEPRKSREWNWDEHLKRSLRYIGVMLFMDLYIIVP